MEKKLIKVIFEQFYSNDDYIYIMRLDTNEVYLMETKFIIRSGDDMVVAAEHFHAYKKVG